MDNHWHDEPVRGPVSQKEYDKALRQLREFQQALGRRYGKQKPKT